MEELLDFADEGTLSSIMTRAQRFIKLNASPLTRMRSNKYMSCSGNAPDV